LYVVVDHGTNIHLNCSSLHTETKLPHHQPQPPHQPPQPQPHQPEVGGVGVSITHSATEKLII